MSASLRHAYILSYLAAGGDPAKLQRLDWFHVGKSGLSYGMPQDIQADIRKWGW